MLLRQNQPVLRPFFTWKNRFTLSFEVQINILQESAHLVISSCLATQGFYRTASQMTALACFPSHSTHEQVNLSHVSLVIHDLFVKVQGQHYYRPNTMNILLGRN